MEAQLHTTTWGRTAVLVLATACAVAMGGTTRAARADDSNPCPSSTEAPYRMHLRALTGPAGADVTLIVDTAAGCTAPEVLKKVQLKTFASNGSLDRVRNIDDVAAPGGVANIDLGTLPRNRRVEAAVLVETGTPGRTYVVRGATTTLLRPDLVVESMQTPPQTLTTRPIDVRAVIAELNGDVGATATATLSWGPTVLATQALSVSKGARVPVEFTAIALTTAKPVELTIRVEDVTPSETLATNNARSTTVDVTENELAPTRLVLPSLGGYGAQFNQHLYAPITAMPPGSCPTWRRR